MHLCKQFRTVETMSGSTFDGSIEVDVENIGGIDETTVRFDPGLTILSGRNATNRTSFLQALMAVHGSDRASLKADADAGYVRLTAGEATYERRFQREDGHVTSDGDPILADPEAADLFAFLLESNEARRAVERGEDLRDLIMRPVDTDAIEAEIVDLSDEKARIDERLDELDGLERRRTELERERADLRAEIEGTEAELRDKRAEIEAADADLDETRAAKAELERKLDELWEARSDLEDAEYDLETEREGLASLREERSELQAELDSLPEAESAELETIAERLETLHGRKQSITADLNQLQNIVQFNEEALEGTDSDLLAALDEGSDEPTGSVTDRLVAETETVVCWTCGTTVEESHVEETLDRLRSLRQRKLQERNDVDEEIRRLQDERDDLQEQRRRREEVQRTLREREREIERREEAISELRSRRGQLAERVAELEATVEDLRLDDGSELLDLHGEANELEFELERIEGDLADVETELESVESRLAEREDLAARREDVREELQERRRRVQRLEQEAVEAFNSHMETVLDLLGYANVERVWIERTEGNGTDGAFDLHVVRESDSGAVYEDTVDHLSESEREVIGLTFALAGYLVHEVHETVPFVLLDSLEALDSGRIADLVEYVNQYADNLVVALLPEDARALDDRHERVTEI